MLLDSQRCDRYREALRRVVRPGDAVVDLGAGTGLLSLFAVQAGARRVYAIEMSGIADVAEKMIADNGLTDRISLIRRRSTRARLPERCDVLVSETLSILAWDTENTLSYTADARRRMLKPDGRQIPLSCETFLVPIESAELGVGRLPPRLYDLDVSALRWARYRKQPIRVEASGKEVLSLAGPAGAWPVDFASDSRAPGRAVLQFSIEHDGRLDGFLGWFEAVLCEGVTVSNSPRLAPTSWGQVYFPTIEQPAVRAGQRLLLEIDPGIVAGWPSWSYRITLT